MYFYPYSTCDVGMLEPKYCTKCQMPIELGEKVSRDAQNKPYHDRHSVTSEEAAEIYLKDFASDLFYFGGTAPKQKLQ